MRSVETRIGELIHPAGGYREDFERVRAEIMRTTDPEFPSDFVGHSGEGFENWDSGEGLEEFVTLKIGRTASDRMTFFHAEAGVLLPSEAKRILEENVNDHSVRIHPEHSWLARRHDLRLYFDPTELYPEKFNPFIRPEKKFDLKILANELTVREILGYFSPKKIYSTDPSPEWEIHDVRIALRKGLTKPLEIFYVVHDEYPRKKFFHKGDPTLSESDRKLMKTDYDRIRRQVTIEKQNYRGLPPPKNLANLI